VENQNPIKLLPSCYLKTDFGWRIIPRILENHIYFITEYGTLVDFIYLEGIVHYSKSVTPSHNIRTDLGAWWDDKFYFFYDLQKDDIKQKKRFGFGNFCMETNMFYVLKLPNNIPSNSMYWLFIIFWS
jgi:hypothetical protein